ncbi:DNA methyltransferase [Staphylococcus haemolyticus]|uniref:DNA methyltransferase n=1 Tax=Staphylococcus haemolyticus TaxID=1283 RepID=UPI0018797F51|nr:site-specific DNA-methyltransferase [Staphylococcus haemolyticus]MBE7354444.1 site-specific DNA-methyltransferase [Staphylococcus haemolyticus]
MSTDILNEISDVLNDIERYWTNEKLAKQLIIEDLRNSEPKLISKLLSNQAINETYVQDIDGYKVFDKESFISMLRYKNYWQDSYTKYANKIGLTTEGKYLNYNSDVVLDFPFKDCVLEGGMTKEDSIFKNEERFYNQKIAKDEIDTLLQPKVFKNMKMYNKQKESIVNDIKATDNLIIKGNNLIALHSIKQKYKNKVKAIYIDPPYFFEGNKKDDSFEYNSNFKLTTWLVFLKNRIQIALELLREDGYLIVQINDYGAYHLKLLLDEEISRYSKGKFINDITVKMSDLSGPKMAHTNKKLPKLKEHVLIYAKNANEANLNDIKTQTTWDKGLNRYNYFLEKNGYTDANQWEITSVKKKLNDLNLVYGTKEAEEFLIENSDCIFRTAVNKALTKEAKEQNVNPKVITKIKSPTGLEKYVYKNEEVLFSTSKLGNINGKLVPVEHVSDIWNDIALNDLSNEGGVTLKNGKKPESLLKRLLELTTEKNDLVLDFFMGSATTQAVAHKLGRQYIGIEQMDYIQEKSLVRLNNVIKGEQRGISKSIKWRGGGSFVYVELAKENQEIVDKVIKSSTKEELSQQIDKLLNDGVLNYEVDFDKFINTKKEFHELELEDQKELLIRVLDSNQLYVNYSDIEDSAYNFTEDEIAFNHSFYRGE